MSYRVFGPRHPDAVKLDISKRKKIWKFLKNQSNFILFHNKTCFFSLFSSFRKVSTKNSKDKKTKISSLSLRHFSLRQTYLILKISIWTSGCCCSWTKNPEQKYLIWIDSVVAWLLFFCRLSSSNGKVMKRTLYTQRKIIITIIKIYIHGQDMDAKEEKEILSASQREGNVRKK